MSRYYCTGTRREEERGEGPAFYYNTHTHQLCGSTYAVYLCVCVEAAAAAAAAAAVAALAAASGGK